MEETLFIGVSFFVGWRRADYPVKSLSAGIDYKIKRDFPTKTASSGIRIQTEVGISGEDRFTGKFTPDGIPAQ